jgi:hypothetical protein
LLTLLSFLGFGLFMCYDILFDTPAVVLRSRGVERFLYNAEIPILGSAVFRAWSLAHNATLISANRGSGGAYVRGSHVAEQRGHLVLARLENV